ncbi:MAG: acyltransferase family protein [Myxococcales bacterium]|nr:acyltransferase family protein [Myxococcales bacterium]
MRKNDIDDLGNRDPAVVEGMVRALSPIFRAYFSPEIGGLERIPEGAALYVGNHNGGFLTPDTYVLACALFRELGIDAVPYGLAHEVPIQWPIVNQVMTRMGAVRASHENAHRLFARGAKVLVYPGGDAEAFRPYRDRHRIVFDGRRGYLRLALEAGVPIVPIVTAGAHETFIVLDDGRKIAKTLRLDRLLRLKVWPTVFSLPLGFTFGPPFFNIPLPTKIRIEVLEPIEFERSGKEAASDEAYVNECNARVLEVMQRALTALAEAGR